MKYRLRTLTVASHHEATSSLFPSELIAKQKSMCLETGTSSHFQISGFWKWSNGYMWQNKQILLSPILDCGPENTKKQNKVCYRVWILAQKNNKIKFLLSLDAGPPGTTKQRDLSGEFNFISPRDNVICCDSSAASFKTSL